MSETSGSYTGRSYTSFGASSRGSDAGSGDDNNSLDIAFGGILTSNRTVLDDIFGYLNSVERFKWEGLRRAYITIWAYQTLVLIGILLGPFWGWDFDYENRGWQWALRPTLGILAWENGRVTMQALLYTALTLTIVSFVVMLHVFYNTRNNKHVHPAEKYLMRSLEVSWLTTFAIPAVVIYMLPLACDWRGKLTGTKMVALYQQWHDIGGEDEAKCFSGAYALHTVAAIIGLTIHIGHYGIILLKDVELDPTGPFPMAQGSVTTALLLGILRVAVVIFYHLFVGLDQRFAAALVTICLTWYAYIHVRRYPFVGRVANYSQGVVAGAFLAMGIFDFLLGGDSSKSGTYSAIMSACCVVFGLAILLMVIARRRHLLRVVHKFKELKEVAPKALLEPKRLHRFIDVDELGTLVRVIRPWGVEKGVEPLPEHIEGVLAALTHAGGQFPDKAILPLFDAAFHAFVLDDTQASHGHLERAKGLMPRAAERYLVFRLSLSLRETQENNTAGDGAMDWMSYVELQRNLQALKKLHRLVLTEMNAFWGICLRRDCGLHHMTGSFNRIEEVEVRAEHNYRAMLERYPRNVKVLRMYAQFLEDVQGKQTLAHQYIAEADKLEDANSALRADTEDIFSGGAFGKSSAVDETLDAVVVVNSEGTIQFVNKMLCKLFGYKQEELATRNVSCLMPLPFSAQHNGYMKAYADSGVSHVINTVREVVGCRKDRSVFPVQLALTKIAQGGEDGFMGVFRQLEEHTESRVWMTKGGVLICANQLFYDEFGYDYTDIAGNTFESFLAHNEGWRSILETATQSAPKEPPINHPDDVIFKHRMGTQGRVNLTTKIVGSDRVPVVVVTMISDTTEQPMLTVDANGNITSGNAAMAAMLGHSASTLKRAKLSTIMPEPFGQMLSAWLRTGGIGKCPQSRGGIVDLLHRKGKVVPVEADFQKTDFKSGNSALGEERFVMRCLPMTPEQARLRRVMQLIVDTDGRIISSSTTPASFGWTAGGVVDRFMEEVVPVDGDPGALVKQWLRTAGDRLQHRRCCVICADGTEKAAVLDVIPDVDRQTVTLNLQKFSNIWSVIEVTANLEILGSVGLFNCMFGRTIDTMVGKSLIELMPELECTTVQDLVAESNAAVADATAPVAKTGGIKKQTATQLVGLPQTDTIMAHADELLFRATTQVAERMLYPNRFMVLVLPYGTDIGAPLKSSVPAKPRKSGKPPQQMVSKKEVALDQARISTGARMSAGVGRHGGLQREGSRLRPREVEKEGSKVAMLTAAFEGAAREAGLAPGMSGHGGGDEDSLGLLGEPDSRKSGSEMKQAVNVWANLEAVGTPARPSVEDPDAVELTPEKEGRILEWMMRDEKASGLMSGQTSRRGGLAAGPSGKHMKLTKAALRQMKESERQLKVAAHVSEDDSRSHSAAVEEDPAAEERAVAEDVKEASGPGAAAAAKRLLEGTGAKRAQFQEGKGGDGNASPPRSAGGSHATRSRLLVDDANVHARNEGTGLTEQQLADINASLSDGGSIASGSMTSGMSGAGKTRRLKRFVRVLESEALRWPLIALRRYMIALAIVLLAAHSACFGTMIMFLDQHTTLLQSVNLCGEMMTRTVQVAYNTRVLMAVYSGVSYQTMLTDPTRNLNQTEVFMYTDATALARIQEKIYEDSVAATDKFRGPLLDLWVGKMHTITVMTRNHEVNSTISEQMTLYDLGGLYVSMAVHLLSFSTEDKAKMDTTREFTFIIENGVPILGPAFAEVIDLYTTRAEDNLAKVNVIATVFLAIEIGFFTPLAVCVVFKMVWGLWQRKVQLGALFLSMPRSLVIELARAKITVDDDDDIDSEEERERENEDARERALAEKKKKEDNSDDGNAFNRMARCNVRINDSDMRAATAQLHRRRGNFKSHIRRLTMLCVPLMTWGVMVAVIIGVSIALGKTSLNRLRATQWTHLESYEGVRVIFYGQELSVRANQFIHKTGIFQALTDTQQRDAIESIRTQLLDASILLKERHLDLVVGRETPFIPEGFVVSTPKLRDLQFTPRCYSQWIPCINSTDPNAPLVQNGINDLVAAFIEKARTLVYTDITTLALVDGNPQWYFLYDFGRDDLVNAMKQMQVAVGDDFEMLELVKTLHVILFVLTVLLIPAAIYIVTKPYFHLNALEIKHMSRLLTLVPKASGVDELLAKIRDSHANRKKRVTPKWKRFLKRVFTRGAKKAEAEGGDGGAAPAAGGGNLAAKVASGSKKEKMIPSSKKGK
ncbi:unnamed protein product [Pedinophyceae sp. YPF-701]|nr:unnamed protein product [Pedinophyceae sp. YPF-701]